MDMLKFDDSAVRIKYGEGFGSDRLPAGLLSLHRWGVLTARQLADASGFSYDYVTGDLKRKLLGHRLIRLVRSINHNFKAGRPPIMLSLTEIGYAELCVAVREHWQTDKPGDAIGVYVEPPSTVNWGTGKPHKFAVTDVLIAIERSARTLNAVMVRDIIPEFRHWRGLADPTCDQTGTGRSFRADAATVLRDRRQSWVQLIEVDRSTETGSSNDPARLWETIEGKVKNHWDYLASRRHMTRYDVSVPAFQVLIITRSQARANNLRALIADCGLQPIVGKILPADVFRFGVLDAVKADFFGPSWTAIDGQPIALVKERASDAA